MPDPSRIDRKHAARVRAHFKARTGPSFVEDAPPVQNGIDDKPAHSAVWLKALDDQELTRVDRYGNHIPPGGGSIPTRPYPRGVGKKR